MSKYANLISLKNVKVFSNRSTKDFQKNSNRSQGCKVRCASNHLIVSGYKVPQVQGVGRADVLLYFKCPATKQMRCPVNAYKKQVRNSGLIRGVISFCQQCPAKCCHRDERKCGPKQLNPFSFRLDIRSTTGWPDPTNRRFPVRPEPASS